MSVDWALRQSIDPEELLRMLRKLSRIADPESEDFWFAHRHIAERSVEREPWLAAISARHVIAHRPDDDGAWAVLGLAYTLMGHYRAAVASYRRAVSRAPGNPWYAHNLGHLLDITMNSPHDAVRLLEMAHDKEPRDPEIAASYAHALGRVGRPADGRKLLKRFMRTGGTPDQKALLKWLEKSEQGLAEQADPEPPRKRRPRRQTS